MAQIVGGFGVPHTPIFPFFVKRDGPDCEIAKLFGAQKAELAAVRPDVIVMFDTDHLNTFFLDNLPIFAMGVDKSFKAPNDEPREVPNYVVPSRPDLAAHIRAAGIAAGFDVGMTQQFSVDHSVTVPLHFLTPEMHVPVIPFFISGHVPPLPSAARCYALGQAVGRAIEAWPESKRVVIVDTRPSSEYAAGHIAGAISVPVDDLAKRLKELPKGKEYVAYCRGPYCVYADRAVQVLRANGRRARRLVQGFPEWRSAGLPVSEGTVPGASR